MKSLLRRIESIFSGGRAESARNLYLDLMIRVIANTIYCDPPLRGPTDYQASLRETGWDWPSVAHSMIGTRRLKNLRELCERVIQNRIPGDFIETGVWRGGACILMRAVLAAHGDRQRRVFCADSFAGLPKPDADRYPCDRGDDLHTFKELVVALETVKENFARYGLLDEQVVFLKGLFEETLPSLNHTGQRFALLRLDGDMYASTIVALRNLYDRLSPQGFVIIDDYYCFEPCKQAVHDFLDARGASVALQAIDQHAVWWQKDME